MKPWLSILLPTIHKDKLARFMDSLKETSPEWDGIELVTHYGKGTISELYEDCLRRSTGEWVWFANDDLVAETPNWDVEFKRCTKLFRDGIGLFWPNDKLLGDFLSCFPLLNRHILEQVFPLPYKKYKVDDTIFHIFPPERRCYLYHIVFRHTNDQGREGGGFQLPDGRIYPIDYELAGIDNASWITEEPRRAALRSKLRLESWGYFG